MKLPRITACLLAISLIAATTQPTIDHDNLKKLAWQLACQSSAFSATTTFDMIEQLHAMSVHHIELSPGQSLSADRPGVVISIDMAPADSDALLAKLKSVKMDVVSIGVLQLGSDEAEARKAFDLAKKFKAKNLVVDPANSSLDMLEKLATESGINVALVASDNDALLKSLNNRSKRLGICADLCAWEIDNKSPPLATVKIMADHIIEAHLTGEYHDVDVLTYLAGKKFKGIFAVGRPSESQDDFVQSVNAFSATVTAAAGTNQ